MISINYTIIKGDTNYEINEMYSKKKYVDYAIEKEKKGEILDFMPKDSFFHPISVKTYLQYTKYNSDFDFAKYNKTASQIVIRWIVQRGLITIPRAKPNHFAENLEVMEFTLSDEDMAAISSLNQNLRSNVLNDPENFPW